MELKNQVCDLKYAQRLQELGVKQESIWYWVGFVFKTDGSIMSKGFIERLEDIKDKTGTYGDGRISAFTTAELGEMLAQGLEGSWRAGGLEWLCRYTEGEGEKIPITRANTEADTRAKMLIYLLENKLN